MPSSPPPTPLNSTEDKLAESAIATPPDQLVRIYENSLAAGILRDIKYSTRKNRREEICAEEVKWVSTPSPKPEFVPEFMSGNSPTVLGHEELGNVPSLHFWSLELEAWVLLTSTPVISIFPNGLATLLEHKPEIAFYHIKN